MEEMNELDPKLQQFADRAAAEIAVPPFRREAATRARPWPRPRFGLVLTGIVLLFVVGSGVAAATGLLSEVFRVGNVSAVGSRAVTLDGARVAQVPLPKSDLLPGGWKLDQVQLTMTESWRSVDLQYRRPGSRGMSIGVWSQGIEVRPTTERLERVTVSGVEVEFGANREARTARFMDRGATVVIRGFANELGSDQLTVLVSAWLTQAQ